MLPFTRHGSGSHPIILLHFFGSSQREWTEVCAGLVPDYSCITIDLPGFGLANKIPGYSVEEMTDQMFTTINSLALKEFILVGHSMSGKLSMNLTSKGIKGLKGLILVGPSPLSPEPMKEKDRKKMLGFKRIRKDAETYLDGITAHPLKGAIRERAIEDFIQASPAAWTAWLEKGSKEDCSSHVEKITLPALVIAGNEDPSLSGPVQERVTMPILANGRLENIPDCGHLPMMEMPTILIALIRSWLSLGVLRAPVGFPEP